jgi:hypothetical protein
VLAAGAFGALLLLVAEFTTLFTIHVASQRAAIQSVETGSHDSYALVPIALLALLMAAGAARTGSRAALSAMLALGGVTLLIGLIGDLPDAQRHGVVKLGAAHLQLAGASPSAGLYLETLGAIVLIVAAGSGLLLSRPAARPEPPPARRQRTPRPASP